MKQKSIQEQRTSQEFDHMVNTLQEAFDAKGKLYGATLFTVGVNHLSTAYLKTFEDLSERAEHDCHVCREFMRQHGNLVFITPKGQVIPAFWDATVVPESYFDQVNALQKMVAAGKVTGVYFAERVKLGHREAGSYPHFALTVPRAVVATGIDSAHAQTMQARENFLTLSRGLQAYTPEVLARASLLINARLGDECPQLKNLQFLMNLHADLKSTSASVTRKSRAVNLRWLAVANAPTGFCNPRGTVIGTLLDELLEGSNETSAMTRFCEKTAADVYQRPVAAPTEGNVKTAEKLIDKLGLEPALHRRFALLDEVPKMWTTPQQAAPAKKEGGVFAHLETKGAPAQKPKVSKKEVNGGVLSWEKFKRTVLPGAQRIELLLPSGRLVLGGVLTAVNADAPPLMSWDREDARNPASTYVHMKGAPADAFDLEAGTYAQVLAIVTMPWKWNPATADFGHSGELLVLEGAEDESVDELGIFPQDLRSELHQVRTTIEAYSKEGTIQDVDGQKAQGLMLSYGRPVPHLCQLRVTNALGCTFYNIDRWD